jgi:hypothetical protein
MRHCLAHFGFRLFLTLVAGVAASPATVINFDAQAAGRGGNLTGIPDSPLTIGIATFTGGELLNAEVGLNADQSGMYASEGLFGSGETNPLVIAFASPIDDFSVLVANGDDTRSYTVSDNLGDSVTKSLSSAGALGSATFSLSGSGITTLSVISANTGAWDFAIDNVSFTAATAVPEPEALLLVGAGLIFVACVRRKHINALVREKASARASLLSPSSRISMSRQPLTASKPLSITTSLLDANTSVRASTIY